MGQMGDGLLALRTALELFLVICPDEIDSRILLSRLYLHLSINLHEVCERSLNIAHWLWHPEVGPFNFPELMVTYFGQEDSIRCG